MFKRIMWIKSNLKKLMPKIYFDMMKRSEIKEHEIYINKIIDPENHHKIFNQKSEKEEFSICNYDLKILIQKMMFCYIECSQIKREILFSQFFMKI